ncbi:hypothetical protein [Peribacillus butanolivorans]
MIQTFVQSFGDVETARATLLEIAAASDIILPGVAEGEFLFR